MKPVYTILIALVVGVLGFFGGMKYSGVQKTNNRQNFAGQFQNGAQGGRFQNGAGRNRQGGGRPVAGEIVAADDKSITVKMQDGQSKIVLFSASTQINKAESADKSELIQGTTVAVFGTENPDGSVTAMNVQLNPQLNRLRNITPTPTP